MFFTFDFIIFLSLATITILLLFEIYKKGGFIKSLNSRHFTDILNLSIRPVICLNRNFKVEFINATACSILGYSQEKILGTRLSEISKSPMEILRENSAELIFMTSKKQEVKQRVTIEHLTGKNKKTLGYLITFNKSDELINLRRLLNEKNNQLLDRQSDLTVIQQQMENASNAEITQTDPASNRIIKEYTLLKKSLTQLKLGVIMIDKKNNISFINNQARGVFSLPLSSQAKKEVDKFSMSELQKKLSPDLNLQVYLDQSTKNIKSSTIDDLEIGQKHFKVYISPVIAQQINKKIDEPPGAIIILEDKTAQRLIRLSRENFFTLASHELRTPLTGIRGYIALIKEFYAAAIREPDLEKMIADIDASSTRLVKIINEFLDKAKTAEINISVSQEPCDLVTIIVSSINDTNSLAIEKKLYLKFHNGISHAYVMGDKDKIKQILINLLSNSLKYTDTGGVIVVLEKTQDNNYKIVIRDTGRGIPENLRTLLFAKYQPTAEFKKNALIASTGLGLYISRLLAEKMGGEIKLEETAENHGSTFSFTLPETKENIAITSTTS